MLSQRERNGGKIRTGFSYSWKWSGIGVWSEMGNLFKASCSCCFEIYSTFKKALITFQSRWIVSLRNLWDHRTLLISVSFMTLFVFLSLKTICERVNLLKTLSWASMHHGCTVLAHTSSLKHTTHKRQSFVWMQLTIRTLCRRLLVWS